ncbi:HemK-like putative methylase [Brachybacterium aquaticum]|uniref:HemK-like putative methylase n=1 Tax=Brachybacterium aquaticum TaxID=1432564 RepID=A0A841AFN2_9MICO|nr:HemK-like putative methylase [Brachybacterium aquaticum]
MREIEDDASGPYGDALVARLRAAGCVAAEEEAQVLRGAARDEAELEEWTARRCAGEFLEQVVGHVDLAGEQLVVAPGVFVPRQRTALLMREALREARTRPRPVVLEMYAGVAPVAAHLARRLPSAHVHAAELDERALDCARRNLPEEATLHHGDGWVALPPHPPRFDVIAAVPPYVPDDQLRLMPREAREHKPLTALLGGEDGLDHVRRMLDGAAAHLTADGVMLLEMHRDQAMAALDLVAALPATERPSADVIEGDDGATALLRLRRVPARATAPAPDLLLLRRVRDQIDREHHVPLDVEALAAGVHLSAGHLSRRFREEYGEPPYSYLMTRRVERAMTLLRTADRSVTRICMDVGFSSLRTFSTRFKELVGVSPSAYREHGAEVLDTMPPCIARKVTRPVRNREAPRAEGSSRGVHDHDIARTDHPLQLPPAHRPRGLPRLLPGRPRLRRPRRDLRGARGRRRRDRAGAGRPGLRHPRLRGAGPCGEHGPHPAGPVLIRHRTATFAPHRSGQGSMSTDDHTSGTFSDAEKEAMRARAEELRAEKAQGKGAKKRESDRAKLEELIAGLPEADRRDATRVHEIVSLVAPQLDARTWYGMPAWALDGDVLCFFTPASKFEERYSSIRFNAVAQLDEGSMWAASFAVTEVGDAAADRIALLVRRAVEGGTAAG